MNDNPYQWEAAVDRSQNGRVLVSGPVVAGKPWPLRVTDNAAAEDLVARINGTNQPPPPWWIALDLWMALGLPSDQFDAWAFHDDERSSWGGRWSQLLAAVQGSDLTVDTNPPAGRLIDLLAARINGTNQPTHTVRADLRYGTETIRHWLVGRTVDSVGLAVELRQWADHFDPWKDRPTEAEVTCPAGTCKGCPEPDTCAALRPTDLPDGVSPWLGDEADAVALCRIAYDLNGDQWRWSEDGNEWHELSDLNPGGTYPVLLRRKPQTVTVELPKDVAEAMCDEVNIDYHTVAAACRKALGR